MLKCRRQQKHRKQTRFLYVYIYTKTYVYDVKKMKNIYIYIYNDITKITAYHDGNMFVYAVSVSARSVSAGASVVSSSSGQTHVLIITGL